MTLAQAAKSPPPAEDTRRKIAKDQRLLRSFTFKQNFENSPQGLPPEAETLRHERELNLSLYIIDNIDRLSSRKYITQKIIY